MITASYDPRADVLYVVSGVNAQPGETTEQQDGLLFRYSKASRKPCGVTVMGFSAVWRRRLRDLSMQIADFLETATAEVFARIEAVSVTETDFEDPDFL